MPSTRKGRCGWRPFICPYSWDQNGYQNKKKKTKGPKDQIKKSDSPPRKSLREIPQQRAGSFGVPARDPVATSEPAAVTSAKGRDEPVVRNLPEVEPGNSLSRASSINTSLQGAGSTGIPAAGGDQGSLVPRRGEIRLAKKALSRCERRKLKKAKATSSEAGTGGIQQPLTASLTKQLETPTENPKRPRSKGSTYSEMVRLPKRPRDWKGPGNYKETLTNIRVAIFKDTFPEDKVTENDQGCILEGLGKILRMTPIELPHLKSYRLEGGA
jgi:hypothetical protein